MYRNGGGVCKLSGSDVIVYFHHATLFCGISYVDGQGNLAACLWSQRQWLSRYCRYDGENVCAISSTQDVAPFGTAGDGKEPPGCLFLDEIFPSTPSTVSTDS